MKTIAIYHKNCNDGTTAAAVVLRRYPDAIVTPMAHSFVPEEIAPIVASAALGDRILTVDCVIGAKEFLAAGHNVTSIDHHAGIQEEYTKLAADNPAYTFVFDNAKCGASLSWATLFPGEPMPELIKYIEDVDLWKWQYKPDSKYVNNYIFLLANKPEEVLPLLDKPLDDVKRDGSIVARYSDLMIANDTRENEPVDVMVGGHSVPFYNITSNKSDAGNILCTLRGCAVGLFTIDGPKLAISFRSLDGQSPSAFELAKALGGGGHRNAAGARMTLEHFIQSIKKP